MRDDRLSPTPTEPARCPVCLGDLDRRGVCYECGRSFGPAEPFAVPALRRRSFDTGPRWYDNPVYFAFGLLCLLPVPVFAYLAPGVLIPYGVLLLPAVIRTIRIATRPAVAESGSFWAYIVGTLIGSIGVATIAGMASTIAFFVVCLGIPGGNSINAPIIYPILGLIAATVVFVVIFILLWPRAQPGDANREPPDPEN